MIIQKLNLKREAKGAQSLNAVVTFETPRPLSYSVFFSFENLPGDLPETADPFLIGFLSSTMLLGESLEVRAPVDAHLVDRIREEIMPLLHKWSPALHEIELRCPESEKRSLPETERKVAIPWGGGLDATYVAVKNLDRIDWLVACQGFDTRTFYTEFWSRMLVDIRSAAEPLGKPLIVASSNVREISHFQALQTRRGRIDPSYYELGRNGPFGNFLAAMGRCMESLCSEVILSANVPYEALFPYGAHPLLDPLWSTPSQAVIHDGCEAGRLEKIAFLKENLPEALNRLRVCWRPPPGDINCGKCEKCVRTMAEIMCNEAESLCSAFSWPLEPEALRKIEIEGPQRFMWEEIQERAVASGNTALAREVGALILRGVPWRRRLAERLNRPDIRRVVRNNWRRLKREMRPPEDMSDEVSTPKETLEEIERHKAAMNS